MKIFERQVIITGILILCFSIVFLSIRANKMERYKSALPEKLAVKRVIFHGQEGTSLIVALFAPVRGYSCGGGVFELSRSTVDAIKNEGLSFFEDATKSRSNQYEYPTWKKTPVPYIWTSNGTLTGSNCIKGNYKLARKMTKALETTGSYYTALGNYRIVVLPTLNLVSFTYYD